MSKLTAKKYDVAIIGGGFYGSVIAIYLRKYFKKVILIEKEKELLKKASYTNQARIHNGYHYPRSILTALRSHLNYSKFNNQYKEAVYSKFKQYYAISSLSSKTTATQFEKFCTHLNIPHKLASNDIKKIFNPNLIEAVFETEEVVYDAKTMRKLLLSDLEKLKVKCVFDTKINKITESKKNTLLLDVDNDHFVEANMVFNCTYSQINSLLYKSKLPLLPLKHEFIEMPLLKLPKQLEQIGVTIMDGPFFGFLPFPDKKCHSLWHVRYSIHANWEDIDSKQVGVVVSQFKPKSKYPFMYRDMKRFVPLLEDSIYKESLYEIKTVLMDREESDGRPILFRKDYGLKNFHVVMGSKIDNIYDILEKIKNEIV